MRVIYIAGTSHSGSTLLDLMLNAHPEMISVGEVMNLNQLSKIKKPNAFWVSVEQRLRETSGRSISDLDLLDHSLSDASTAPNVSLFKAIADVTGKNYIVDSSKNPERMAYLMRFKELHVYPIHLIRNPKGQIASAARKHGGFLRHIAHYERVHQCIRKALKGIAHSVVRYEDLVLRPEQTLATVLEPIGLTYHPRQLSWAEHTKHLIAGNRMKRSKTSELILDERWRDSLSFAQKLLIDIGTVGSRSRHRQTGYVSAPKLGPEVAFMKMIITAFALVCGSVTSVYAQDLTAKQIEGVQTAIKTADCAVEDATSIVAKDYGYKAAGVVCTDGKYTFKLDKDFKVFKKTPG